jgi:RNA-binding protein 8A
VVFVTGLQNVKIRDEDIMDVFSENDVKPNFVRVNCDRNLGTAKGYVIVEYSQRTQAQDAINKLHGTELCGTPIGVHWAFVKPSFGDGSTRKRSRP